MTQTKTVHVRIEGRVQGVSYRAWTEEKARGLGLRGWVRNRRDRTVEAVFEGPAQQVDAMLRACEDGPRAAHVTRVEVAECDDGPYDRFEIRPTA